MHARLYQRPKHALQSGRAHTGEWLLEFERDDRLRADPLTGWAGSGFTAGQVQLRFSSRAAALAYAAANGLEVEIVPLGPRTLKLQAYADNFR
ncbi:NADH dehydrogenase ubiquinone Fe-S protein 4 [Sandarakinorhabdus rubra]|uniref:NADH dehydrogenase ubiquinone Fe-S protein 4 n=1 Tax=Sandarakinorhabdus rubra TaxID=2672568 RepID=UPI0013DC3452|nr:NADH dehydrogenase ubiquinone Fe-S protein 4 [Sandarakinorhabdus rubra]